MGESLRHRPLKLFLHFIQICIVISRTMGLIKKTTLFVLIIALLLGLIAVKLPVPDDMVDPWHARAVSITVTGATWMASFGSMLGIAPWFSIFRFSTDLTLSSFSLHDASVKETRRLFGGVPVVLYDPVGREENSPAIVYFHGGGWSLLSADAYRYTTQTIAKETKYLVVSVDYRLAPEHLYPIPLKDCLSATKYFIDNAYKYRVDGHRVAVAGDSSGGNLAAAVTLAMVGHKKQFNSTVVPKAQVLIYPPLQFINLNLPSNQNDSGIILHSKDHAYFSQFYAFGDEDEERVHLMLEGTHVRSKYIKHHSWKISPDSLPRENFSKKYKSRVSPDIESVKHPELERLVLDPYFAPLMADDLSGVPATLIQTCQYDILRDDGFLFAHRLEQANVNVKHINYKGGWHGALSFGSSLPFFKDIASFLKRIL